MNFFKKENEGKSEIFLRTQNEEDVSFMKMLSPMPDEILVMVECPGGYIIKRDKVDARKIKSVNRYSRMNLDDLRTCLAERGFGEPEPNATRKDMIELLSESDMEG